MILPRTTRWALLYCSISIGFACSRSDSEPPPVKTPADGRSCIASATGAFSPSDFLSCTEIDSFNSEPVGSNLGTLHCEFSRGELCRFYNVKTDEMEWRYGRFLTDGPVFENKFAALVSRPPGVVPKDGFVFVGEPLSRGPADSAILRADFKCQRGVGHVTFDFWRSVRSLRIQICTGGMTDTTASRYCTNPVDYDLSLPVTLPVEAPARGPFFVEIVVTGVSSPSVFILDNLSYTADLCNSKLITANVVQSPPLVGTISVIKKSGKLFDACSALTCDFSDTICNYSQDGDENSNSRGGRWQLARGKIGNPHTGIKRVSSGDIAVLKPGFAYIGQDMVNNSIGTLFILESPNFTLEKDTLLSFDLYQRSHSIKFKVCFNNLTNCPYSNPPLDKKTFWYEGESVMMPKRTAKVFFVATQIKRNTWIALDNIVVNQGLGCKPLQPSLSPLLFVGSK